MKQLLLLFCFGITNVHADKLTDPTKPSLYKSIFNAGKDSKTITTMSLTLTAIINNNQNRQAIIDGISFTEGQQVQGYKVILIGENHVVLDGTNGKQTLFVNNNNIKKDTHDGF
ncbi:MAG: MSHA biogenesis protein MshK [Paraglaciecola sp.]|jgi:MSHA biogenesis protein MshK